MGMLALVIGTAGCGAPPILDAASAYGKTTEDAVASAGNEPASIANACTKRARLAYLLNRLKHQIDRQTLLEGTFDDYFATAEAIPANTAKNRPAMKYKEYCAALESASKPYQDAVGVLSRYGAALAALSGKSSVKIGDDVSKIAGSAGDFMKLASGNDVSDAAKVVATELKDFADLLIQQRVAEDVSAYVIAADPAVQKLLDGMIQYDAAVGQEVKNLRSAVKTDTISVEGLYHLAGPSTPPPSAAAAPAGAAIAPPASGAPRETSKGSPKTPVDVSELRADIETLRKELHAELTASQQREEALQREVQALKPALFFELAENLDAQARTVEDEYAKYHDVLTKWKLAHSDLVKVAKTGTTDDLASLLGTVADLATRMKDIQGVIQGGKQ